MRLSVLIFLSALGGAAALSPAQDRLIHAQERAAEARRDLIEARRRTDRAADRLHHTRYAPPLTLLPAPNYAALEVRELAHHQQLLDAQYGQIQSLHHTATAQIARLAPQVEAARVEVEQRRRRAEAARSALNQAVEQDPELIKAEQALEQAHAALVRNEANALAAVRQTPTYGAVWTAYQAALADAVRAASRWDLAELDAAMANARYQARALAQLEEAYLASDIDVLLTYEVFRRQSDALAEVERRTVDRVLATHPAAADLAAYEQALEHHDRLAAELAQQQYHLDYAGQAMAQTQAQLRDVSAALSHAVVQARYHERLEQYRQYDQWRQAQQREHFDLQRLRRAQRDEERAERAYVEARRRQEREARKTHLVPDPPSYRSPDPPAQHTPAPPTARPSTERPRPTFPTVEPPSHLKPAPSRPALEPRAPRNTAPRDNTARDSSARESTPHASAPSAPPQQRSQVSESPPSQRSERAQPPLSPRIRRLESK